jgi:pyridoxamine 5'-phosphate oxidase
MTETLKTEWTETLPDTLPANPMQVVAEWLAQARADAAQPNPNAMVLATVDADGQPSARVVLCKDIGVESGFISFYTNYESRKGRELAANPSAAIVFHWDYRRRQVRAEGRVERLSDTENDAYFAGRPWRSQLGAWASHQSEPVASRGALAGAVAAAAHRLGIDYGGPGSREPEPAPEGIPRPANWGGFKLKVRALELWVEGAYRIHDRARWTRTLDAAESPTWIHTRLQP